MTSNCRGFDSCKIRSANLSHSSGQEARFTGIRRGGLGSRISRCLTSLKIWDLIGKEAIEGVYEMRMMFRYREG